MKIPRTDLAGLGERGFLKRILPALPRSGSSPYLVSPGDDAAVLRAHRHVLSIDGLTEGTHFKSSWAKVCERSAGFSLGRGLGWKLMGSSLSDLAAMGVTKNRWAMIYLACPGGATWNFLSELQRGVNETARRFDCAVVGGDTVRAKDISLVSAVGGTLRGRALTRSGAKKGDLLCIAGTVGDASIGLNVLQKKIHLKRNIAGYFIRRFFEVRPLFIEGEALSRASEVSSLIDLSDALKDTLDIVSAMSHVGFKLYIDQIPVSPHFAKHFKKDSRLLTGGEDYSLMFTVRASAAVKLRRALKFSVVGEVVSASQGISYFLKGKKIQAPASFQHFS